MVASIDNASCGYYGYDGNGNRAYKLTGQSAQDQYNAGEWQYHVNFNDAVLYVNPYFIVTPKGYTRHYYNGSMHIASQIGRISDLPTSIIDTSAVARERIANAQAYMASMLSATEELIISAETIADIDGDELDELQWQCLDTNSIAFRITLHSDTNMLFPVLNRDAGFPANVLDIYYYHADHLGSASWITNKEGTPIEYIHYMPYGELWYDWQASSYNERFKFTGKERDTETGYDYFGARFYSPVLLSWLSPDPFIDKNAGISSYAFCSWNPINRLDPNGMDDIEIDKRGFIINYDRTNYNDNICIKDSDDPQWERELSLPGQYISESFSAKRLTVKGDIVQMDFLPISDDMIGEQIFSFVADNTDVEWSLNYIDEQGTILSTSHQERSEAGCSYIFNRYSMRGHTHNHPFSINPSASDKQWAQKMLEKYPLAPLKIYYYGTLYNYNAQGLVAPNVK